VDMKLEVVVVPVSDVDRAKDFYQALGWRLDADFVAAPDFRVIQMTSPGSACDGNSWFVQEVTTRLPGWETSALAAYDSVAGLGDQPSAHGNHEEETGQPHPDRTGWYAQYMVAESARADEVITPLTGHLSDPAIARS
jgi:catechol 2,3-dioxygenase-like lactoylglutathione lyase family enzyme